MALLQRCACAGNHAAHADAVDFLQQNSEGVFDLHHAVGADDIRHRIHRPDHLILLEDHGLARSDVLLQRLCVCNRSGVARYRWGRWLRVGAQQGLEDEVASAILPTLPKIFGQPHRVGRGGCAGADGWHGVQRSCSACVPGFQRHVEKPTIYIRGAGLQRRELLDQVRAFGSAGQRFHQTRAQHDVLPGMTHIADQLPCVAQVLECVTAVGARKGRCVRRRLQQAGPGR